MCFFGGGGGGGSSSDTDTKSQTAKTTRKANEQTSPYPAETTASNESEVASIESKRKGRKSLRIPLLTGSSGVQV